MGRHGIAAWWQLAGCGLLALVAVLALAGSAPAGLAAQCEIGGRFLVLSEPLPDLIGSCVGPEVLNAETGDIQQPVDGGVLVLRSADNTPMFTDGWQTWLAGPNGIETRLNSERLAWEPGEPSQASAASTTSATPINADLLATRPSLDVADMYAVIVPSVVKIQVSDQAGNAVRAGSGVRVAAGIVTNAHVVGNDTSVTVVLADERQLRGQVVKVDEVADLALVTTEGVMPELEIERSSLQRIGDAAYVVGFPRSYELGGAASLSRGIISGFRNGSPGVSWIQTDAAMNPGNSGGGLFNGQGKLIGIPAWGLRGAEGLNFAISADTVTAFLVRPGSRRAAPAPTPSREPVPTVGPVPARGPGPLIVDATGGGDYPTISSAYAKAKDGETIVVRPGTYKESLTIDRDVRITGEGGRSRVVVEGSRGETVFTFTGGSATLTGLTLRAVGIPPTGKGRGAIAVFAGTPVIEDCELTSSAGSAVFIVGVTANPTIRNCTIKDSRDDGVVVYDKGQGTIEQCVISQNAGSGVSISNGGNPTVRDCEIRDNKSAGVFAFEQGLGTFERCVISGNAYAGVTIRTGGNPTVRDCEIRNNRAGVYVSDYGQGLVEKCVISGNALSGMMINTGGNLMVWDCEIRDNREVGIVASTQGQGTIERCVNSGNAMDGVAVTLSGNLVMRDCEIRDNRDAGVNANDQGQGTFTGNRLIRNDKGAWNIKPTAGKVIRTGNMPNE